MHRVVAISTCSFACAMTLAAASRVPLSGAELKSLVAGATVEIDAPMGYKIPVRYAPDGTVTAEAGGLASYLGSAADKGRWWVSGEYLCHKWSVWFSRELQCLRLSREGRTLHWESKDGSKGTASIAVAAPPIQPVVQETAAPPAVPRKPPESPPRIVSAPVQTAVQEAPPPAAPAPGPQRVRPEARPETRVDRKPPPSPAEPKRVAERPALEQPRSPVPAPVPASKTRTASVTALPRIGPEEFVIVNVRADDVLNVRSGPSPNAEIVGELAPGSRGIELFGECQNDWCPVQHISAKGWVHRRYIASASGEPMTSAFPARIEGSAESGYSRRGAPNR